MVSKIWKAAILCLVFTAGALVAPGLTTDSDDAARVFTNEGTENPAPPQERHFGEQKTNCFDWGTIDQYGDCDGAPRGPCPC